MHLTGGLQITNPIFMFNNRLNFPLRLYCSKKLPVNFTVAMTTVITGNLLPSKASQMKLFGCTELSPYLGASLGSLLKLPYSLFAWLYVCQVYGALTINLWASI